MHLVPDGLPSCIPGSGEEIDKAMQQAPQPDRHFIGDKLKGKRLKGAMVQWLKSFTYYNRSNI
jgi:hypothetical protein